MASMPTSASRTAEAMPLPRNGNAANGHAKNGTPAAVSLAEAARTAMLQAERDLIVPMLHRVHWNRRKAARLFGNGIAPVGGQRCTTWRGSP